MGLDGRSTKSCTSSTPLREVKGVNHRLQCFPLRFVQVTLGIIKDIPGHGNAVRAIAHPYVGRGEQKTPHR